MEQSPWEANSRWASQEIPRLLRNPMVNYRFHNSPALVLILSQMNPVPTSLINFSNSHSNVILPSMPLCWEWSLFFRSSDKNSVCIFQSVLACYMTHTSHPPCFDYPNSILCKEQIVKNFITQFSSASYFLPLRSKYFQYLLRLCSSLNVTKFHTQTKQQVKL